MRSARTGWRAAIRIARRDALRAPGRSALIVAMVALPVLGMAGIDVLYRTSQLSPAEKATRELGAADVAVTYLGGSVQQSPNLDQVSFGVAHGSPAPPPHGVRPVPRPRRSLGPTTQDLVAQLPGATAWTTERSTPTTLVTATGQHPVVWRALDYRRPVVHGLVDQADGRAPRAAGEVAVTTALSHAEDITIGDTVHAAGSSRAYEVVGTVSDPSDYHVQAVFGLPGSTPVPQATSALRDKLSPDAWPRTYVQTSAPVTWADVLRLNHAGLLVLSRDVLLNPPPHDQQPLYDASYERTRHLAIVGVITLIVGLAMLEVVLLAGAAFAVGARRQRRSLALVAVAGGDSGQVRRIVLAGGLVLGAVGAAVGVALGSLGAIAFSNRFGRIQGQAMGAIDVRPLELLAIAGLGLVTGLLAAVLPARSAARANVVEVLAGRAGTRSTKLHVPIIGLVLAGFGVLVAGAGSGARSSMSSAKLILAGTVLVQVGVLVMTPAIVGLSGWLGGRFPLAPRLALRDASRHRGRTAPAVGAVMAAVAGSTALAVYITSNADFSQRHYEASSRVGTATVQFSARVDDAHLTALERSLTAALPTSTAATVDSVGCNPNIDTRCSVEVDLDAGTQPRVDCRVKPEACAISRTFFGPLVGGPELLRLVTGRPDPAAAAALRTGHAVVFVPGAVQHGQATLAITDDHTGKVRRVHVPAVTVSPVPGSGSLLLPPSLARRFGPTSHAGVFVSTTRMPTPAQEDAALATLGATGVDGFLALERGYHQNNGGALLALLIGSTVITLGAAGIATGLAAADGRADMATLAAVGAAPHTRRVLAGAQALTVAGLGTVLGIAVGFVPATAYVNRLADYRVLVPWRAVLTMVVLVPALAAGLAAAVTRSRLPLERRLG